LKDQLNSLRGKINNARVSAKMEAKWFNTYASFSLVPSGYGALTRRWAAYFVYRVLNAALVGVTLNGDESTFTTWTEVDQPLP
jgi:hypothetical protein